MIAESLAHDRQALRDYLTEVILQTTLVGSLLGILSGIFFGVSSGISYLVSVHDFIKWRTAQGNQEGSPDDGGFHPVVRNPVHRFVLAREG